MSERLLSERLQQLLPMIRSDAFLHQRGIGNEIGYHIFDYAPQDEGRIREYIQNNLLPKRQADFPFLALNLFDLILDLLEDQGLREQVAVLEAEEGHDEMEEGLRTLLSPAELAQGIKRRLAPQDRFIVLYGLGQAWPILRSHELLNNMHAELDRLPILMFFPGRYDAESLIPFEKVRSDNYYRAFQMVPRYSSRF